MRPPLIIMCTALAVACSSEPAQLGVEDGRETPFAPDQVAEGSYQAQAVLDLASVMPEAQLIADVGLSPRAAAAIATIARSGEPIDPGRRFVDLHALDDLPWVGPRVLAALLDQVAALGSLGRCGDHRVQTTLESCDAASGCPADCGLATCGDGVRQSYEACDGGSDCAPGCHVPWQWYRGAAGEVRGSRRLLGLGRGGAGGLRHEWLVVLEAPARVSLDVGVTWLEGSDLIEPARLRALAMAAETDPIAGRTADFSWPASTVSLLLDGDDSPRLSIGGAQAVGMGPSDASLLLPAGRHRLLIELHGSIDLVAIGSALYAVDLRVEPSLVRCGDGVTDDGELCDDGNQTPGDGCDQACALESYDESEPNDDGPSADWASDFRRLDGHAAPGDVDVYRVHLPSGAFRIEVAAPPTVDGACSHPMTLELRDLAFTLLSHAESSEGCALIRSSEGAWASSQAGHEAYLVLTPEAPGSYRYRVRLLSD